MMKPIALAFKDYQINPFTDRGSGELMIIHQCLKCGKLSPNRIAGDDDVYQILSILKESINQNVSILSQIQNLGLEIITTENREEALVSLLGINYQNYIESLAELT